MAGAIDPKALLLSNKALIAAYVVALVPIALYFVIVGDLATQVDASKVKLQRAQNDLKAFHQQLTDPENPLYTEQDKTRLGKRKTLYEAELTALDEVVAERDAPLERWFPKYKDTKKPEFNDYVTEWEQNQIPELITTYSDLLGDMGKSLLFVDVPGRSELADFQKRFWVQQAILEALKKGGAQQLVSPGVDFRSKESGPGDAFAIIPVRLSFRSVFSKVPLVIKELLSTELTIRIDSIEVTKDSFEFERDNMSIDGTRKVFLDFAYGESLRNTSPPSNPNTVIGEPAVKVQLKLEIYDFGKSEEK